MATKKDNLATDQKNAKKKDNLAVSIFKSFKLLHPLF